MRYPYRICRYNQIVDIEALLLSLKLAIWTLILILPFGVWVAHSLQSMGKSRSWIEAALALPLVLPPTVLGYYLLVGLGGKSFFGIPLVFSFTGILIASLIVNLPFAIQPIQRAFEAINPEIREAAQVSGLSKWQIFRLIEFAIEAFVVLLAEVCSCVIGNGFRKSRCEINGSCFRPTAGYAIACDE